MAERDRPDECVKSVKLMRRKGGKMSCGRRVGNVKGEDVVKTRTGGAGKHSGVSSRDEDMLQRGGSSTGER